MSAKAKPEVTGANEGLHNSDIFEVTQRPTTMSADHRAKVVPMKVDSAPGQIEIPIEIAERAQVLIERYERTLQRHTEAFVERESVALEAGEPTLASGYQYWNCLTVGPFQFTGNPPYGPSRIIAANEWTLILGVVWINPLNSPGGGLPGTDVLGARNFRVRFETVNQTSVSNGPDGTFTGLFSSPAPVISVFPWWFRPADPGVNPALFETSMTVDIVQSGQPLAAFSTWHVNPEGEPPFLGMPAQPGGLQYDMPARYMVYRK